jgi:type I restriction enzyme R subunit
MKFDENSRVKIPGIVHATRLGYKYLSLKEEKDQIDDNTNIFKKIFKSSIERINNIELSDLDVKNILNELNIMLSNEDLGKAFYNVLINGYKGKKLIDFNNIDNNELNVVTELPYKNGDDNFRPDIILLVNGMPLSFIEVKKPNNREGILAERDRINKRFHNNKLKKFANLTQLLVFSNNQEYNDDSVVPIEGAFYGTPSYDKVFFNCFREENTSLLSKISDKDSDVENFILKDTNYIQIKGTPEYSTNLNYLSPTNRIITSLFHKDRFFKILKYGIAYVERIDKNGIKHLEKHIMRYQQFFATLAIEDKINSDIRKGIIWHTQGSGKTALAYYNVKYLTDYFQKKGKVAKFYFIVDRLDLLTQAKEEFIARGLSVTTVNTKEEFKNNISSSSVTSNNGELNINVVNIQKFSDESCVKESDYNVNIQRVYFMDEAHRSYNPRGSFLSNLLSSDREAIMIALTGTPLISQEYSSKDIFGDYIHKYYYNKSIADGYTLKLIREGIETTYRTKLNQTLQDIKKDIPNISDKDIFAHKQYTKALTEYIINDFKNSKLYHDDYSIGGMIVCDSSDQARNIFNDLKDYNDVTKALILHDEDDVKFRKDEIDDFKKGKIDLLVVYNMLLTGFDAPRLKKLYLGRIVKSHNLLQTLTRVNRPYHKFKYGYVVDFADITEEFNRTNDMYFKELQEQLGDDFDKYSNIFLSKEEIEECITDIKEKLFQYDIDNLESFSSQISDLDKKELISLRKTMGNYKDLFNIIKAMNYSGLASSIPIDRISKMIHEVERRIDILNLTDRENSDSGNLLNVALADIEFSFKKISEEELQIADKYKQKMDEVRKEFLDNIDKDDPKYIELFKQYKEIFTTSDFENITTDEINTNINKLDKLLNDIQKLNSKNNNYLLKYQGDPKYVMIHKRVIEKLPDFNEYELSKILLNLKNEIDELLLRQYEIMDNEPFFKQTIKPLAYKELDENNRTNIVDEVTFFTDLIVDTYLFERRINNE